MFGPDEPAGSFSTRIELACRLGIIPEWCQKELHLIRKIRNEFSHGVVELSFKDSPVRDFVGQLTIPPKIKEKHEDTFTDENGEGFWDDPKGLFLLAGSVVLAEMHVTFLNLRDNYYPKPEPCLREFNVVSSEGEA